MNGLNVLTVEKQRGVEARLKQNFDTDLAVRLRSLGAALAEHENKTKKLWIHGMSHGNLNCSSRYDCTRNDD